uniref:RND efflux system outer membrane lipoprotein NodT family n=1 Tax=uncultured microorganism TaxID=358574 RepID=F8UGY3_9ZZZZ|nr:RND efflux system outer membrane lipoprotein NodT family [uncultured microorganism]
MSKRIFIGLLAGTLLLPGCTLYTKPEVNTPVPPEVFKVTVDAEKFKALNNRWWENFNNSQLNALVEKALENNMNYQVAIKNIDIAQTYVLQNMTLMFPQLGVDYELSRNKNILNVGNSFTSAPELTGNNSIINLQTLTATVNYEIDAWNQVHNAVDQAKADKDTSEGNANIFRLTLISSVVTTYFQIMALNENISHYEKQYAAAFEIAELTEVQYRSGLVDDALVYTAKNNAETILSSLKTAQKQQQVYLYTLAYLLGEYPEEYTPTVEGKLSDLKFDALVPQAIPSNMLAVRPDIQASFSSILSFGYIEKQNIANFLPSLSLSGTYGYANNTLAKLINQSNVLWNFGLSALQTVIDYPALYSQWKRSQIQYEAAILTYKNTLINAYTEVDAALVTYKQDTKVLESNERQLYNDKELLSIAKAQYSAGLTNYIDYLTNDINWLQGNINLTSQQLSVTQDIVQVYKTLGLGTEDEEEHG